MSSMSRFADAEGKTKLEIFDPEKGIVISLYLSQEEYHRANADMSYATELLNIYEDIMNRETQRVSAETIPQEQSHSGSQSSSQNEDGFWSHGETQLLINLYGQHKDEFTNAKKKTCRSAAKIERKWINLLRVYRSIKDNKGVKKSGRGAQNYKFFDALDEILGDKPSNSNTFCIEVGVNKDQPNSD
ncbi:unnamed protein product [Ceutorhynchus assimilis]|uniref:Myb-like domain-containing protein n=1 Tax=Ceutorhynchus assimilis TaxID=467358 RepID=A0A9N9MF56_9CUCU|nr:unnamed protein product [Ceutorhynchus assimilis]